MTIANIQAANMELTDAIRSHVEKRISQLEKLTMRFEPATINVQVGKTSNHHQKGEVFRAEFNLDIPGKLLRTEATKEDLYEAIDVAKEDLKRQLSDHKDQLDSQKKFPRPGKE